MPPASSLVLFYVSVSEETFDITAARLIVDGYN